MTRRVRGFGLFWWDFIVGDDYRLALGVVVALAITAGLSRAGVAAWWLLPLVVLAMLGLSVLVGASPTSATDGSASAESSGRVDVDLPDAVG